MLREFYKKKKVLITGHTGFKGTWLTELLTELGAEVFGYSVLPSTNPSMYEMLNIKKGLVEKIGDVRSYDNISSFVEEVSPEIVFHLAAQPLVRESYKEPVYTFSTNIMGTVNILESCRKTASVKSIVIITTDKVYEDKNSEVAYDESDRLGGHDPYSSSKVGAEIIAECYKSSYNMKIATARAGNVIGGGDYSLDRIIPDCVKSAIVLRDIGVRNPKSTRPYQFVLEPLLGYVILAKKLYENPDNYCEAFNFGPDRNSCVNTQFLVEKFCEFWGNGIWWEQVTEINPPHEATYLFLDNRKAVSKLNWIPKLTVSEAVELVVDWEKSSSKKDITKAQICKYLKKANVD